MGFDELTNEEQIVFTVFWKLMKERGLLKEFYFFQKKTEGLGGFCIYKEDGKWISYTYERGEIIGYRDYIDLYSLCMDTFEALDKASTDYCLNDFPLLVEQVLNSDKEETRKI